MKRIPVWLDCDPGHDDALAIILAGHSPRTDLLGISTVAGNQTVEKVTNNALRVLQAAGLDSIDVVAGAGRPFLRSPLICPEIHGESGLDGPQGGPLLPPTSRMPVPGPAVVVMHDRMAASIAEGRAPIQLVATGSLTNVALLLSVYPSLIPHIEVVFMGGCLGVGNTGPAVEFNIQVDPESAAAVLASGVKVSMVPLEVTHTALVGASQLSRVLGSTPSGASRFRSLVKDLLLFFAESYRDVFRFKDPPLHDPCAVAYVLAPQLFTVMLRGNGCVPLHVPPRAVMLASQCAVQTSTLHPPRLQSPPDRILESGRGNSEFSLPWTHRRRCLEADRPPSQRHRLYDHGRGTVLGLDDGRFGRRGCRVAPQCGLRRHPQQRNGHPQEQI